MSKLQAEGLLTSLVAAYPQVSLEAASVELYTLAFQEMEYEAAHEAVGMLIKGSSRWPAIADIRELYMPIRMRRAETMARTHGLPEPAATGPTPDALAAIRNLAERWGSTALSDFADRMEVSH